MKKLTLLFAAGALATSVNAQQLKKESAVMKSGTTTSQAPTLDNHTKFNMTQAPYNNSWKTTAGGSRWYNYVDLLILFGSDPTNNWGRSFMSNRSDLLSWFGSSYDTVFLASFASVLDPGANRFNDIGLASVLGDVINITNQPFTVDSVRVYGEYMRNPSDMTTVDTLRIALVYGGGTGTNLPIYQFVGGNMPANFGYDTVRFAGMSYDTVTMTAGKANASNPAVIIKDVYLTASSVNDTVSDPNSNFGGLHTFAVNAGNVNIPAGQLVGASVTFIGGQAGTPWDTARTQNDVKVNHWRAWFFTEKTNDFPTYTPGDWNVGLSKYNKHFESASWQDLYVPPYAYNSPVWHENPLIEYKLSCATCPTFSEVGINDVNNVIGNVNAFPNPANETVTIPVNLTKPADVQVSLISTLGQVIETQKVSNAASGAVNFTFNTKNLADGIYFYSVKANGQNITKRIVIAH